MHSPAAVLHRCLLGPVALSWSSLLSPWGFFFFLSRSINIESGKLKSPTILAGFKELKCHTRKYFVQKEAVKMSCARTCRVQRAQW